MATGGPFHPAHAHIFALRLLRADAPGDRGQRVVVEQAGRRAGEIALVEQIDEARDIHQHRAPGNAFRRLALQAAPRLQQRQLLGEPQVHFIEIGIARMRRILLRHLLPVNRHALFRADLFVRGH